MPATELSERVATLTESFVGKLPDPIDRELRALLVRLREPMRVAVVGRVKAGKSTIVNALLGQRVAPTGVSECTRLVTWFRYGYPQRIELELKDGRRVETQLDSSGMLPQELPVPPDQVASIQAYLTNDVLKDMILIDTPGIGSVHEEFSAGTEELLALTAQSNAATAQADAVVFLLNQVVMEDEHRALRLLASAAEESGSAANTVGVLSKADKLGDEGDDPWPIALELATRYSERFSTEVSAVVPVLGLIAETSDAATLTESDAMALAALAGMEPARLEPMFWSPDRFVDSESPVSRAARERLLEMLDLYGIEKAISFLRAAPLSTTALRDRLAAMSGISDVRRVISALFNSQDDVLKVRSVLDLLNRLTYRRDTGAPYALLHQLRTQVEELRMDPQMHAVAEVEAWHACCTGKVQLPPELAEEFKRLVTPMSLAARLGVAEGDPVATREAATAAMARWRAFMVTDADPGQASVARVALRSFQLAYAAATDPPIASIQSSAG